MTAWLTSRTWKRGWLMLCMGLTAGRIMSAWLKPFGVNMSLT